VEYMNLPAASREKLIADLAAMPGFLDDSFANLPPSVHALPGPNGSFSPVEHAWHLADLEEMGFALRIRRLRAESHPELADFAGDDVAKERNYKSLSLRDGIEAFRVARQKNLATLANLAADEWTRGGEQEGVGAVSLCDIPSMMAAHDESHRREVRAWLDQVRAGDGA